MNPISTPKPACIAVLHELILVLLIATAVTISISPDVLASDQTSSAVRPIQKLKQPGDLTLTIQASRSTLTAGSGFGLTADIKNVSAYPIDLSSRNTVLMLPPELEGFSVRGTTAFFAFYPTDTKETDTEPFNTHLTLEPGNDYTVEWSWDQDRPEIRAQGGFDFLGHYIPIPRWIKSIEDTIASELQFTFFPPGDYKVNVVVRYHVQGQPSGTYQTAIQSALVHVAAPQSVIIVGAIIGGLLGYVISRIYQKRAIKVSGAIGAALLSAIITILLARIAETQFLIRVNVSDFWGAIAVGFVASFTGVKILDIFIPSEKSSGKKSADTESKSAAPQANVAAARPQLVHRQPAQHEVAAAQREGALRNLVFKMQNWFRLTLLWLLTISVELCRRLKPSQAARKTRPPLPDQKSPPAFTSSEAALLAAVTEKFYGSASFKALGLALVGAMFLAGSGIVFLGIQSVNLHKRVEALLTPMRRAFDDSSAQFYHRLSAINTDVAEVEKRIRDANSSMIALAPQIEQLRLAGNLADQIPKMRENLEIVTSAAHDAQSIVGSLKSVSEDLDNSQRDIGKRKLLTASPGRQRSWRYRRHSAEQ